MIETPQRSSSSKFISAAGILRILVATAAILFAVPADATTEEMMSTKDVGNSAQMAQASDIALSIGRSAVWAIPQTGSINVSNGSIVRVADEGKQLRLTAVKLGTATIKAGAQTLDVNVIPEAAFRLYATLQNAIKNKRGIKLSAADGKLKITGRLLRAEDWLAIADALQGTEAGKFQFQATVDADIEEQMRATLTERLKQQGLSHIQLKLSPDIVALAPTEPRDARKRAEAVLAPFGIRVESNSNVLSLEPMVRVKIVVAEVKKSFERQYGINWPSAVTGQLLPDQIIPTLPIDATLNALETHGWGRVLASPNILCRSGKEAEFMAGGEFPIKLSSFRSSDVVWKSYGIMLHIKPLADLDGNMSIEIGTEVSALDHAHAVDNIPAIVTNKMTTHFDLTKTRTIALSGLIKSDLSNNSTGLPWLSTIPILGPLFSSRDFKDDRSELIIFVTPEVMRPDDEALEKTP